MESPGMMIKDCVFRSLFLSHDILGNPLLQMRVTLTCRLSHQCPNDAVRVSNPATAAPRAAVTDL
jgi:hypothetical protein